MTLWAATTMLAWAGTGFMWFAWRAQRRATATYRRRFLEGVKVIESIDSNRRELEAVNTELTLQAQLLLDRTESTSKQLEDYMFSRERVIDQAQTAAAQMRAQLDEYRAAQQAHREELIERRRETLVARLRKARG